MEILIYFINHVSVLITLDQTAHDDYKEDKSGYEVIEQRITLARFLIY